MSRRRPYAQRCPRPDLHRFLRANLRRIAGLVAVFVTAAAVIPGAAHGYALGFLHSELLAILLVLVALPNSLYVHSTWPV